MKQDLDADPLLLGLDKIDVPDEQLSEFLEGYVRLNSSRAVVLSSYKRLEDTHNAFLMSYLPASVNEKIESDIQELVKNGDEEIKAYWESFQSRHWTLGGLVNSFVESTQFLVDSTAAISSGLSAMVKARNLLKSKNDFDLSQTDIVVTTISLPAGSEQVAKNVNLKLRNIAIRISRISLKMFDSFKEGDYESSDGDIDNFELRTDILALLVELKALQSIFASDSELKGLNFVADLAEDINKLEAAIKGIDAYSSLISNSHNLGMERRELLFSQVALIHDSVTAVASTLKILLDVVDALAPGQLADFAEKGSKSLDILRDVVDALQSAFFMTVKPPMQQDTNSIKNKSEIIKIHARMSHAILVYYMDQVGYYLHSTYEDKFTSGAGDYFDYDLNKVLALFTNNEYQKSYIFSRTFKPYEIVNEDDEIEWVYEYSPSGTLSGHVLLEDGTLDLKGKTLRITGDFIQTGGILKLSGGKLIVDGDYRIESLSDDDDSYGRLVMTNSSDYVEVHGDFVMGGANEYYDDLSAGTLEIRGDFTQHSGTYGWGMNFHTSGSHRVLLSGAGLQRVNFESSYFGYSQFNKLEITNSHAGGVVFMTPVVVADELVATTSELHNARNIALAGTARITGGEWKSDLSFRESSWVLQQDQVIAGDVYLEWSDPLDLNGHTLQVKGNFFHWGGSLNINGGKLQVGGDYRIERFEDDGSYAEVYGRLVMTNSSDYVEVHGDFVMDSSAGEYEYRQTVSDLTAGALEVRGNFTQRNSGQFYGRNFHTSGSHRVLLSGSNLQRVNFESPYIGSSQFNKLEITNSSAGGVVFMTPVVVADELVATTSELYNTRNIALAGTARITGGEWKGDLSFRESSWVLQQDQVIAGDVYLEWSDPLDLNGHTLQVKGNFFHWDGSLNINGGKLQVGGDYRIERFEDDGSYAEVYGRLVMTNSSDYVEVHGDFVMDRS